jgi:hypothetical protein
VPARGRPEDLDGGRIPGGLPRHPGDEVGTCRGGRGVVVGCRLLRCRGVDQRVLDPAVGEIDRGQRGQQVRVEEGKDAGLALLHPPLEVLAR